jgi:hypothetical protein
MEKIYLVYAIRERSGAYVTFEMVTHNSDLASKKLDSLRDGGGNQEDHPIFGLTEEIVVSSQTGD